MIDFAPSLYVPTKRVAYLSALVDYLCCMVKNQKFVQTKQESSDFDEALNKIVSFRQQKYYVQALRLFGNDSSEALTKAINRCSARVYGQDKQGLQELRSLNRFRLCVDNESLMRVKGRLSYSLKLTEEINTPHSSFQKCPDQLSGVAILCGQLSCGSTAYTFLH